MTDGGGRGDEASTRRRIAQGGWRSGTVGPLVLGVLALAAVLLGWQLGSARLLLVAAFCVVVVPVVLVEERRRPTWLEADADGLTTGRGDRPMVQVAWREVRRGRPTTWGRPREKHLERTDGTVVALPTSTPAGTVDRWRAELAGAEPLLSTPGDAAGGAPLRTWEQTEDEQPRRQAGALFSPLGPWTPEPDGDGYVTADADEVTVILDGTRTVVAWTDLVAQEGRRDRWDDEQVLLHADGTHVRLPQAFPRGRVEEWREELGRPAAPHR